MVETFVWTVDIVASWRWILSELCHSISPRLGDKAAVLRDVHSASGEPLVTTNGLVLSRQLHLLIMLFGMGLVRFGEMYIPAVVDWFQTEESSRLLNMANDEGLVWFDNEIYFSSSLQGMNFVFITYMRWFNLFFNAVVWICLYCGELAINSVFTFFPMCWLLFKLRFCIEVWTQVFWTYL